MRVFSICVIFFISAVHGLRLPKYIKPCMFKSPDFKQCAIQHGNDAIPIIAKGDRQIGTPSFIPFKISSVTTNSNGLNMNLTDATFTGIETFKIQDFVFDPVKKFISTTLTGPLLIFDFDYVTEGKISSLSIQGQGKGWVKFYNGNYSYSHGFDTKVKNGQHHVVITEDKIAIEPEKMECKLDNLFNGDKLLGDNLNKFLNENWRELLVEFGPTISEVYGTITKGILTKFYEKISLEEMYPDLTF